jgi:glycosyltransferase involved in cell wall biosynthesis
MRVLSVGNQYPPHHFGGYELVWESAVEHWRSAGHSVRVLASDYRHPEGAVGGAREGEDVHRDLRWYWRDHGFPHVGLRRSVVLERHNASVFGRHVEEFAPDVVAWWSMGGMSMSLIAQARRRALPALAVVHDAWVVYGRQVDAWTAAWRSRPRLAPVAERLTRVPTRFDPGAVGEWSFNSEVLRQGTLDRVGELGRTSVIPPGIDEGLFSAVPAGDWAWRLLYVGRVEPRKGIDTAIRALAALPKQATLGVVGGGDDDHLASLRELTAQLGLSSRVRFAPAVPREDLPAVYAACDAVVFPVTWQEPWGLVPLEAMGIGRAVVATGTGGSGEYLRDGENCLLFEPGDHDGLATALTRLASEPSLRDTLRAEGARTAAEHTEARFNARLEEVLRGVAGEGPV